MIQLPREKPHNEHFAVGLESEHVGQVLGVVLGVGGFLMSLTQILGFVMAIRGDSTGKFGHNAVPFVRK